MINVVSNVRAATSPLMVPSLPTFPVHFKRSGKLSGPSGDDKYFHSMSSVLVVQGYSKLIRPLERKKG